MALSGSSHGACAISRHLKLLLPSSSHKLLISDELSRHLDGGAGGTALLVGPFGKVWRVEVGRDGGGAFLGRGWSEFVGAHGIGVGWFLVFRHEGGGVLTVKAFDTSWCLREFTCPLKVAVNRSGTGGGNPRRPQFIRVLLRGCTEHMVVPSEFVRNHIAELGTNSRVATVLGPHRKFWRVEVEKSRSGNVLFAGGWSQFLVALCTGSSIHPTHPCRPNPNRKNS